MEPLTLTIFDLPTEVLGEIFAQCDNPAIWETCKPFVTVAFSTTSLWTTVIIRRPHQFATDGPPILRERISRARGRLLDVCIELYTEHTAEVSAMCKVLSEFNAQIHRFELTTHRTMTAGAIVHDIFSKSEAIPALEVFSALSGYESTKPCAWPQLDLVLVNASTMFPNLRKLHMNSFHDALPILPSFASFSQLTTLILDGSLERYSSCPSLIAALLHCTPQLESLWMKHYFWDNPDNLSDWRTIKGRSISQNIQLPKLKHLAVSVPGTACELIGCIAAPVLEDLHLDGSRGPTDVCFADSPEEWSHSVLDSVYNALKLFALRCQNVRRFAITEAYLSRSMWEWLLFGGDGRGPPFPMLECIALHGVLFHMPFTWNEFDDKLMEKFARDPKIPLKKLALLHCNFLLSASVLVDASRASGAKELEYDEEVPQWEGGEKDRFDELRVSLTRWHKSQVVNDGWWTYGHWIDATDSEAY